MTAASSADLPGLDLDRLRTYLDAECPGLIRGPLTGELIQGGRSNLTYTVSDGVDQYVVRRPPLGHVLATAHDMSREHRVMSALASTSVPVPATHVLCQDEQVLGAPFYVMEHVPGTVYRSDRETTQLAVDDRATLAHRLIDVLAQLHSLSPETVGLGDFGRPEGFLQRQLRRWNTQLSASRGREIPGIDELAERLSTGCPHQPAATIVHGDYRLDNVLVDEALTIQAVLDWEMATIGDPLTDLGLLVVYWEGFSGIAANPIAKGIGPEYHFPTARQLLERYAQRTGADLSPLNWYIAFGFFKIAVILEGIHYRYMNDQTVGEGFEHVGSQVEPLVAQGLATLRED